MATDLANTGKLEVAGQSPIQPSGVTAEAHQGHSLLPIFLKIKERPCLVAGAGHVALKKIEALLECGAQVHVVAKESIEAIRNLAQIGALRLTVRHYEPEDLSGVFLVIAATNDPHVNEEIFRDAKSRGILINAVDVPRQCDFFFPAIVRRGSLQIAVSTSGQSPAFAQRLKEDIDSVLPESLGTWLDELGSLRRKILETVPAGNSRMKLLASLASRPLPQSPGGRVSREAALQNSGGRVLLGNAAEAERGMVYFISASHGNPELLTLRAASLLATADVVVHDSSVPQSILNMRAPEAALLSARLDVHDSEKPWQLSLSRMTESAKDGRRVARLFAGSPGWLDVMNEEIAGLRAAGVPYEVVLGISDGKMLPSDQDADVSGSISSSRVV